MKQNSDFIDIISLKRTKDPLSIKELQQLYYNNWLNENIRSLINSRLNDNEIKNKSVLLKPNWVKHSIAETDLYSLRTHDNVVLTTLEVILDKQPSYVIIGDAPIQGAKWDLICTKEFSEKVKDLSNKYNIKVIIKDFRRRTFNVLENNKKENLKSLSDYIIFDLAKDSYLEPITDDIKTRFRVTNYDPDRMQEAHSKGVHKYCITKDLFQTDIIISIPKLKTHQKTGITGALKNIVGINGDKDFLPHHRLGGTKNGGDCYPGKSNLRYLAELALDKANRRQGNKEYRFWQKLSSLMWKLSFPGDLHQIAAGWHGNDTTWRMVLDLNKIALYGKSDGTIANEKQRVIYTLGDGIIGGQGNGPLEPLPLPLGVLTFTNNSIVHDSILAILMQFPIDKLQILSESEYNISNCSITVNSIPSSIENLRKISIKTKSPIGWKKYFESP